MRTDWSKLLEFAKQVNIAVLSDDQAKSIVGSSQTSPITFEKLGPMFEGEGFEIRRSTQGDDIIIKRV